MAQKLDNKVGFARWKQRWDDDMLLWHKSNVNPRLLQHSSHLFFDGEREYKVFVPLCGKTVDMKWFYDKGCTVVGVEYCLKGCEEFMKEQNVSYSRRNVGDATVLESDDKRLRLWCCNLFDFPKLSGEKDFNIIWDRGSFVAVNFSEREKYVEIMRSILSSDFRYLLEWVQYDGTLFGGPPKTSSAEEIESLFGKYFELKTMSHWYVVKDKSELPEILPKGLILISLFSPKVTE